MGKVFILLPAYNEADVIADVLQKTYDAFVANGFNAVDFVVVDDGSRDETAQRAASVKFPVTVLKHEKNQGLGAAIRTGLVYIANKAESDDLILSNESDGTQEISSFLNVARELKNGKELVVASPQIGQFIGVPFYRRFLSTGANGLYSFLFPIDNLTCYTNLTRGFRASLLQKALEVYGEKGLFDENGFEAVPDLIIKLGTLKPKAAQIPIVIDFTKKGKPSTIRIFHTILKSLRMCFKNLFCRTGKCLPEKH